MSSTIQPLPLPLSVTLETTSALLLLALISSLASCHSTLAVSNNPSRSKDGSSRLVIDAKNGNRLSFAMEPENDVALKIWNESFQRQVWFQITKPNGESAGHQYQVSIHNDEGRKKCWLESTRVELLVEKKGKVGFTVTKANEVYSTLICGSPGHYLLTLHVICYDRHEQLLYSGKTAPVVLCLSNRPTFAQQLRAGHIYPLLVRRKTQ